MNHSRWLALSLVALTGCPNPPPPPINVGPGGPVNPPVFGTPVNAEITPPPISGGTLLVLSDGLRAAAADPDRDAVFITALDASQPVARIALDRGDEPGRLVQDRAGRIHVALRGRSHVAVIDPATNTVIERREACRTPRGVAYDADANTVHVACADGQLVSLDASSGQVTRRVSLERDLRDVVLLSNGRLAVSRFRSAQVLEVTAEGTVRNRATPESVQRSGFVSSPVGSGGADQAARAPISANAVAHVAWRIVPAGNGQMLMLHQRALDKPIETAPGGYGSGGGRCGGGGSIVESAVSVFDSNSGLQVRSGDISVTDAVLAVDVALSPNGQMAVAVPGNARVPGKPQIIRSGSVEAVMGGFGCIGADRVGANTIAPGQVTAVAFANETLVVQLRQPAALFFPDTGRVLALSAESREDTGHSIFHSNSGGGLACASCHAEGDDDGHTWNFASIGPRRTQTFRGGLSGTEPFHWDGDMQNIGHLMNSVFTERMSGPALNDVQVHTLQSWIDRLPARAAPRVMDPSAARGRELFFDQRVACASCHSGPATTNNQNSDVGTGAAFQVPTLRGISWRAPFMHNGCAATLRDRFTNPACGGGDRHGVTSHLNAEQINDLVAYLETL
ncbi:MAG: c-type cytochrome [Polyangiales bacterium]